MKFNVGDRIKLHNYLDTEYEVCLFATIDCDRKEGELLGQKVNISNNRGILEAMTLEFKDDTVFIVKNAKDIEEYLIISESKQPVTGLEELYFASLTVKGNEIKPV